MNTHHLRYFLYSHEHVQLGRRRLEQICIATQGSFSSLLFGIGHGNLRTGMLSVSRSKARYGNSLKKGTCGAHDKNDEHGCHNTD